MNVDLNAYDENKAALFLFALKHIYNIKPVMELFTEALKSNLISIKIVAPEQTPFGAMITIDRRIFLANNLPITLTINALLFELCNAANPNMFATPCSKYNNADDFATAKERVEYDTILRHSSLMTEVIRHPSYKAILKKEFPKGTDILIDQACKDFLENYLKSLQHTFEESLEILKIKKPGELLSHYDNYKKDYQDWQKQYRPNPKNPVRIQPTPTRSGRKLPTPPIATITKPLM